MGKLDTYVHTFLKWLYIEYIRLTGFISPSQQELSESHNSLQIPFGVVKSLISLNVSCNRTPGSASVLASFGMLVLGEVS